MKNYKEIIIQWFEENGKQMTEISDKIWDYAEICFREYKSSTLLADTFEENGFTVTKGVAGIDTAFVAEWSNGEGPVIALIGEFDAIPDLGHKVSEKKEPIEGNGHGCGHNLLGVGSMSAGICLKKAMTDLNVKGTVKYFGCPAEEGGAAKVYMVKDHVFDGIDAIVRWHPINITHAPMSPSRSKYMLKYTFINSKDSGKVGAHIGRNAMNAAMLMDSGVYYIKESLPSTVIRTTINNGEEFDFLPFQTDLGLSISGFEQKELDEALVKANIIAKGVAEAMEVDVEISFLSAYTRTLPNKVLMDTVLKNMLEVGTPGFTDEEKEFARKLNEGISIESKAKSLVMYGITDPEIAKLDLHDSVSVNMLENMKMSPYSTDSGDVSWQAPMCQFFVAGQTIGSSNHSWQQVVCSGSSIGHKGMLYAGKVISMTAMEILISPELLAKAKDEFNDVIKKKPYTCPLPKDAIPGKGGVIAEYKF